MFFVGILLRTRRDGLKGKFIEYSLSLCCQFLCRCDKIN